MATPNNERVSQLVELFATDIQTDDILLATDTSQKESKKVEVGQLLLYFEKSGSYLSYNSVQAQTASYVSGGSIDGAANIAIIASSSVSASYASRSFSSSYAKTASWASFAETTLATSTNADTASFLKYTGIPNGTASYANSSFISYLSTSASYLLFVPGVINGSASYAQTSSVSLSSSFSSQSISASYAPFTQVYQESCSWASSSISSSYSDTSSTCVSSSFAQRSETSSYFDGFSEPVKAWAMVTWSVGKSTPFIVNNYNLSSITWLNRVTSFAGTTYWDQFGVSFQSPLQNANYILIGNGDKPYGISFPVSMMIHPTASKSTSGFTMSIASAASSDFYTTYSGAYAIVNFQILGL